MTYNIISIAEYQPTPGVEAPREKLSKVTFWHPDNVRQGVMITVLPPGYSNEWLQQRIEAFVNSPLVVNLGQSKPGPGEVKNG